MMSENNQSTEGTRETPEEATRGTAKMGVPRGKLEPRAVHGLVVLGPLKRNLAPAAV